MPEQPPSTNQLRGPRRRFVPGANKRPRVYVVKNTHLKPSCHRVGNNDRSFPTPNATRRVPSQRVRTTRLPAPVRGPTNRLSLYLLFILKVTFNVSLSDLLSSSEKNSDNDIEDHRDPCTPLCVSRCSFP
jgi:hypothetical protein